MQFITVKKYMYRKKKNNNSYILWRTYLTAYAKNANPKTTTAFCRALNNTCPFWNRKFWPSELESVLPSEALELWLFRALNFALHSWKHTNYDWALNFFFFDFLNSNIYVKHSSKFWYYMIFWHFSINPATRILLYI